MATKTEYEVEESVNGIVKDYATLQQMQEDGQLKPFSNYFTPDEDVNFSQMRMVELWTNPNPTASFGAQTITLNSPDYDYLIVLHNRGSCIAEKAKPINLYYEAVGWYSSQNDTIRLIYRTITYVDDITYSVSQANTNWWNNGLKGTTNTNAEIIPYKIIGLKKEPSMIYTGAELFAGNGVNIKDGVVSVKTKKFIDLSGSRSVSVSSAWSSANATPSTVSATNESKFSLSSNILTIPAGLDADFIKITHTTCFNSTIGTSTSWQCGLIYDGNTVSDCTSAYQYGSGTINNMNFANSAIVSYDKTKSHQLYVRIMGGASGTLSMISGHLIVETI